MEVCNRYKHSQGASYVSVCVHVYVPMSETMGTIEKKMGIKVKCIPFFASIGSEDYLETLKILIYLMITSLRVCFHYLSSEGLS